MFRIRRIYDAIIPIDREAVLQVQNILRSQFHLLSEEEISRLPELLRNPLKYKFRYVLLVADDLRGHVKGFALMAYAPDLSFCYLDFISTERISMGRGVGGALYERVREEARSLKVIGLFFECLPDDGALCRDADAVRQNGDRLRFYERFGARPVVNTRYETPLRPGDDCPPYLVFDNLGQGTPLRRDDARRVARALLERKYGKKCPPNYIDMVIESFQDEPVRIREPRYVRKEQPRAPRKGDSSPDRRIALVVNEQHAIHHVQERGYVESPVRIRSIMRELMKTDMFDQVRPLHFSENHIRRIHNNQFIDYFKKVCENLPPGKSVYPYVFPIRNAARPPKELSVRAGYFCIDTFTPLNGNAYQAAVGSVDCSLTASKKILEGYRIAYALVRPPGHHAERNVFGGFCYFNSAAIAANYLGRFGRVAVLDVDYHHGNGTQEIFYNRQDVLTVSIHGHPNFAFPYFSGFEDERGTGDGEGFNINFPLPEQVGGEQYREVLGKALRRIARYRPHFLVISLGLDTARGDPTGTWALKARDFEVNGRMIGALRLPTLVVQEGGYDSRVLGTNARNFFVGLWEGIHGLEREHESAHARRVSRQGAGPAE